MVCLRLLLRSGERYLEKGLTFGKTWHSWRTKLRKSSGLWIFTSLVEVKRGFRPIGEIETQEGLAFGETGFLEGPINNVVADRCAMA